MQEDNFELVLELIEIITYYPLENISPWITTIADRLTQVNNPIDAVILFAELDAPKLLNDILSAGSISTPVNFSGPIEDLDQLTISTPIKNMVILFNNILNALHNPTVNNNPATIIALLAFYEHKKAQQIFANLLYNFVINPENKMLTKYFIQARQYAIDLNSLFAQNNAIAAYQLGQLHNPRLIKLRRKNNHNSDSDLIKLEQQTYEEACKWYNIAYSMMSENDDNYPNLCYEHGYALWKTHENKDNLLSAQLIAHASKLIHFAANKEHSTAQFTLGEIYQNARKFEDAIEWYEKAVKHHFNEHDLYKMYVNLANLLPVKQTLERNKNGLSYYQTALAIVEKYQWKNPFKQKLIEHYKNFDENYSWEKKPPHSMARTVSNVAYGSSKKTVSDNTENEKNRGNNIKPLQL